MLAGHRHRRVSGDVQRGDQKAARVVGEDLTTDDHFLGALYHQHDTRLDDTGNRWGRCVTSVDAEICDVCREVASCGRVCAYYLAQRGQRVRRGARLCGGRHGKLPMIL
ncbi:hypothetical protein D3C79_845350 [compost metagenome]